MYPNRPSDTLFHEIAQQYGTPVFIYDGDRIVANYKRLVSAFSQVPLKVKYAMKALPSLAVLQLLKREGAGIDAVSVEELRLALHVGFEPSEITYTPSCPRFDEIEQAVELGVDVTLDSLEAVEQFSSRFSDKVPCAVRIRPDIEAGGHSKIQTGHSRSKFGLPRTQFGVVLNLARKGQLRLEGLHVHTGSDISDVEVFAQSAEVIFDLANELESIRFLDFGGGFKVPYKEGEEGVNLEAVGKRFQELYASRTAGFTSPPEVRFEPGKYLVSESGFLASEVSVVKKTPEETFVGVNTGLNHLIRPMFYDAYHEIFNVSGAGRDVQTYTVVGYICETDTFATDRILSEVFTGDVLVFANAGAYCASMSSNYNSRLRPPEVLIHDGEVRCIRRRETLEDLLRGQVGLEG